MLTRLHFVRCDHDHDPHACPHMCECGHKCADHDCINSHCAIWHCQCVKFEDQFPLEVYDEGEEDE